MTEEEKKKAEKEFRQEVKRLKDDLDVLAFEIKGFKIENFSERGLSFFEERFDDVCGDVLYWGYGVQTMLYSLKAEQRNLILRNLKQGFNNIQEYKKRFDQKDYTYLKNYLNRYGNDVVIEVSKFESFEQYKNYWYFFVFAKFLNEIILKIEEVLNIKAEILQPHHKDEPAPKVVNTELLEQIRQRFETMDKKGYQYAFRTEDDFYNFCNVLALYFDNGTFNDIETIQLNPRTKTRIASTLNLIYSKFIKDDLSLKTNKDFFRIVRFLAPYQEKTDNEIYKALIR